MAITLLEIQHNRKLYIAQVTEVDNEDATVNVSFMTACGKVGGWFRWPRQKEECWVDNSDVVCTIAEPVPTNKSGHIYSVPDEIFQLLC